MFLPGYRTWLVNMSYTIYFAKCPALKGQKQDVFITVDNTNVISFPVLIVYSQC